MHVKTDKLARPARASGRIALATKVEMTETGVRRIASEEVRLPRLGGERQPDKSERDLRRPMERIFEADTREEANRKADEWWAKAKGVRFIHRSQTRAGFRSNPSKRWVIAIHFKEEVSHS
jgi:hypothetical protein